MDIHLLVCSAHPEVGLVGSPRLVLPLSQSVAHLCNKYTGIFTNLTELIHANFLPQYETLGPIIPYALCTLLYMTCINYYGSVTWYISPLLTCKSSFINTRWKTLTISCSIILVERSLWQSSIPYDNPLCSSIIEYAAYCYSCLQGIQIQVKLFYLLAKWFHCIILNKYTYIYLHVHCMCKDLNENYHLHFLSSTSALLEVRCPLVVALGSLFAIDLCETKLVLSTALFILRLNWVYIFLYAVLTLKFPELGLLDLHCLAQGMQLICVTVSNTLRYSHLNKKHWYTNPFFVIKVNVHKDSHSTLVHAHCTFSIRRLLL